MGIADHVRSSYKELPSYFDDDGYQVTINGKQFDVYSYAEETMGSGAVATYYLAVDPATKKPVWEWMEYDGEEE